MEWTGKVVSVSTDWVSGQHTITFSVNEKSALNGIDKIKDMEKLSINAEEYKEDRSNNANRLMWHCLSAIGKSLTPPIDKWQVYLMMLRRYGKFTYICVKPNMIDAIKRQWRECEVVGDIDINGQKAVQMICYFGSSTYNTKEFSILLDGIISEMEELGLQTPPSEEMRRALEQWEKMNEKRNTD